MFSLLIRIIIILLLLLLLLIKIIIIFVVIVIIIVVVVILIIAVVILITPVLPAQQDKESKETGSLPLDDQIHSGMGGTHLLRIIVVMIMTGIMMKMRKIAQP